MFPAGFQVLDVLFIHKLEKKKNQQNEDLLETMFTYVGFGQNKLHAQCVLYNNKGSRHCSYTHIDAVMNAAIFFSALLQSRTFPGGRLRGGSSIEELVEL